MALRGHNLLFIEQIMLIVLSRFAVVNLTSAMLKI